MIVVAHTQVLLNLCCIGQAKQLTSLFREVLIPSEVASDFRKLASETPRFDGLALPHGLREQKVSAIPNLVRCARLDPAASAALALAAETKAGVILVEKRRLHEVALQLGLQAIGVLGILSEAKAKGLLPRLAPLLDQLETKAGFKITPALRARVLRDAGEGK